MHLNPEQKIAALHVEGPLLVLAGAGSGKTRIVTSRIVHLLELGVPSSEIVAVTFTNKAADEMRRRVRDMSAYSVLACTFHSLCARILRESIGALGYNSSFTIYDEDDSLNVLKSILALMGQKEERSYLKQVKGAISTAKNTLVPPDDLQIKRLYDLYQKKLLEYNALDFDDLLFLTVKLFQEHPEILQLYQKRWRFLLIDEYQDTNQAQYLLAKLLVSAHHNLFVVGDPDQSIYSWRGANIRNILEFERDFPGAKVVKLEQNYRSTSHILSAANALIAQNENRYEKKLWSALGEGEKVGIYISESEQEEARIVAQNLLNHHIQDQVPLKEMAIFYRANAQSRTFEDVLMRNKIPYEIVGGLSFYDRREIKDVLALLRLSISPADFISFSRTINLPRRGFGKVALEKLSSLAESHAMPIFDLCVQLTQGAAPLSAKQVEGLREYVHVIHSIQDQTKRGAPLRDLIRDAIEHSRYLSYLKEDDEESFEERQSNLEELTSKGAEWEAETGSRSLSGFLEELSLNAFRKEHGLETIKLMTLHNGKGLEFEVVFIVGLEEDLLPHINSKDLPESLEEERRLCYVGMTRAKRHLYLTAARYRLIWGTPRLMEPSRFLDELPTEHIHCFSQNGEEEDEEGGFPLGTPVSHKDFGRGVVRRSYQTSMGLTYDVYFPHEGETRTLVAKYARLVRQM